MRFLADTHLLLWWALEPARVPLRVRDLVAEPTSEVHVSHVSTWELAIKLSLGKLELPVALDAFLTYSQADLGGARPLPMRPVHLLAVQHLPFHHRDPFDRLLVAQARQENLTVLSADRSFERYAVRRVWD